MLYKSNPPCETLPFCAGDMFWWQACCVLFATVKTAAMGRFLSVSNGLMEEAVFGGLGFVRI